MSAIKYRPEIDGLRAFAVIPVIIFHLNPAWLSAGYAGVDVFFVISGFLITSIIISDFNKKRFSMLNFWERRLRRIFPMLVTVVLATITVVYLWGYKYDFEEVGNYGLSAILSFANISLWRSAGNYWDGGAEASPFLHCWSLSVEEQFYVLYPLFLVFTLRFARRFAHWIIAGVFIASYTLFIYGSHAYPIPSFYLLPTRAWELAAGCLTALVINKEGFISHRKSLSFLQSAGMILIIASYIFMPIDSIHWSMIFPVLGASLVIAYGNPTQGVGLILSNPVAVYIGKISYSLYLWHWPIIWFIDMRGIKLHNSWAGPLIAVSLTFTLSALSYWLIETPMRKKTTSLYPIIGGILATVVASLLITRVDATRIYYPISSFEPVAFYADKYDITPTQATSPGRMKKLIGVNSAQRLPSDQNAYANGGIVMNYGGPDIDFLVLGDSHAGMWSSALDSIARENKWTICFMPTVGTDSFIKDYTPNWARGRFTPEQQCAYLKSRNHILETDQPTVILSARWASRHGSLIDDFIKSIGQTGSNILFIGQPPEVELGDRNSALYLAYLGYRPQPNQDIELNQARQEEVLQGNQQLDNYSEKYAFCEKVDVYDLFNRSNGEGLVVKGKQILYYDDDHLSEQGAWYARQRIAEAMKQARQKTTATTLTDNNATTLTPIE